MSRWNTSLPLDKPVTINNKASIVIVFKVALS